MGLGKLNPGCGCVCEVVDECPPCTSCSCYEDATCTAKYKRVRVRFTVCNVLLIGSPPFTYDCFRPAVDAHAVCSTNPLQAGGVLTIQVRYNSAPTSPFWRGDFQYLFSGTQFRIRPQYRPGFQVLNYEYVNYNAPASCDCSLFTLTQESRTVDYNSVEYYGLPQDGNVWWWVWGSLSNGSNARLPVKAEAFPYVI